jgi:murein DD-endopeptidase MepM/ murein hydrolase activator NlpD
LQAPQSEQKYTVMVVPEQGAKVERLTLSGPHIVALGLLSRLSGPQLARAATIGGWAALVLLGTTVGMAWHYFSVVGRVEEVTELREQKLQMEAQLAKIKGNIAHINETLARVKHLYATLQNISQLREPDRKLSAEAELGTFEEGAPTINPDALAENLGQLAGEADAQEESLRALTGYFQDQQALLASAPSIWPARGWVTSDFGFRLDPFTSGRKLHAGLDIANAVGTPIVAPADGVVVYAANEKEYGNVCVIDHGSGLKTRYGHMAQLHVRAGERVTRGTLIGAMGNTGRSTGPHLHYEVRVNGAPENPRKFILETTEPTRPVGALANSGPAARGVGGGDALRMED